MPLGLVAIGGDNDQHVSSGRYGRTTPAVRRRGIGIEEQEDAAGGFEESNQQVGPGPTELPHRRTPLNKA